MSDQLSMFQQTTLPDTGSATSSPASADGRSPHASPDGQTTASCGQAPHRASRSVSPANSERKTTNGTYGPTYFASPVPDGPLPSWESRLRQRLARIGSTECLLTWNASVTPAGRSLSRLVPSMGRTVEIVSGSSQAEMALWVTASARDWKDTPGMTTTSEDGRSRIDQLPRQVAAACWPTPTASLADKGVRSTEGAIKEAARSHGPDLAAVTAAAAMWPTPTATDAERGSGTIRPQDTGIPLPQRVSQVLGTAQPGSSATMEKPGALSPTFVAWLMGFPMAWMDCAPTSMPKRRKE